MRSGEPYLAATQGLDPARRKALNEIELLMHIDTLIYLSQNADTLHAIHAPPQEHKIYQEVRI